MKEKCEELQFFYERDFWGFKWIGHCYYIESKDGDMLFGDKLSKDLDAIEQYCRAANIAHEVAIEKVQKKLKKVLTSLQKELM